MNPTQEFDTALKGLTPEERATYTKANPNVNVGGVNQAFNASTGSFNTITPESLKPQAPMKVLSRVPLTGAVGLQGEIESGMASYAALREEEKRIAEQDASLKAKQTNLETSKTSLIDRLLGRESKTALEDKSYTEAVDPARKELDDINSKILAEQVSNRRKIEMLDKTFTGTLEGKNMEIERINRESTAKQADLAVIQYAKQNNYARAKEIADRKINVLLEKDAQDIDLLKFAYNENKESYNTAETRKYNEMIAEKERSLNKKDADLKTVSDLSIEALKGGAPASVAAEMRSKSDPADAMRIGGQYIGTLDRQKSLLDILKLKNEVASNSPITGQWASVVNGAAGLVASTKKQTVKQNIATALSNEDYTTAYAEIANAVSDGITGTNKTKFDDARTDIGVMNGLRSAIQAFTDAGGNLGYLKGTADDIAKKFGQLAFDPKFAALGVQLQREFQTYRLNMTGAAFSPAESREYASVNPRTNASLDLNLATIDGAIAQLSNRVTSTVNARVPDAKKIWDKVSSVQSSSVGAQQYTLADGTIVTRQADGTYK